MDDVTAPDRAAAERIAADVLCVYADDNEFVGRMVVDALDAAKLLRRPDEAAYVAALEAVAGAARNAIRTGGFPELTDALTALDAVPAAGSGSGEARDQALDAAADRAAKEILANYGDHDLGLPDARPGPEVIY